eukprot:scaffold36367_cov19-Prasinocladus_malaysianus.AAC.1
MAQLYLRFVPIRSHRCLITGEPSVMLMMIRDEDSSDYVAKAVAAAEYATQAVELLKRDLDLSGEDVAGEVSLLVSQGEASPSLSVLPVAFFNQAGVPCSARH